MCVLSSTTTINLKHVIPAELIMKLQLQPLGLALWYRYLKFVVYCNMETKMMTKLANS